MEEKVLEYDEVGRVCAMKGFDDMGNIVWAHEYVSFSLSPNKKISALMIEKSLGTEEYVIPITLNTNPKRNENYRLLSLISTMVLPM